MTGAHGTYAAPEGDFYGPFLCEIVPCMFCWSSIVGGSHARGSHEVPRYGCDTLHDSLVSSTCMALSGNHGEDGLG